MSTVQLSSIFSKKRTDIFELEIPLSMTLYRSGLDMLMTLAMYWLVCILSKCLFIRPSCKFHGIDSKVQDNGSVDVLSWQVRSSEVSDSLYAGLDAFRYFLILDNIFCLLLCSFFQSTTSHCTIRSFEWWPSCHFLYFGNLCKNAWEYFSRRVKYYLGGHVTNDNFWVWKW